jgi:transcription antitermination factor NusG
MQTISLSTVQTLANSAKNRAQLSLSKGDTVKIVSGKHAGKQGFVSYIGGGRINLPMGAVSRENLAVFVPSGIAGVKGQSVAVPSRFIRLIDKGMAVA